MFALRAVQAFFGDSLIIEFGTAAPHYLLIDGGPAHTYDIHLHNVLGALKQANHDLDLMVLSHVDTDHVTGLLDFVADIRSGNAATLPSIAALWHNSFAATIDPNGTLAPRLRTLLATAGAQSMSQSAIAINGIGEGQQLRTQALAIPVPINPGFPAGAIVADTAGAPRAFDNLSLTIVGPTQANLDALRDEWEQWTSDHENAVTAATDPFVFANSDRSVPNLSSIQLLAEADGKSMLLTGDGRSDHLLQALDQAGRLDSSGAMHVDLLKLPHHGSDRNVTKTFFKKVTADIYVASADGTNDNPDLATLIWIAEASQAAGRPVRIVCTNRTPSIDKLESEYDPTTYGYTLDVMNAGADSVRVQLSP